MDHTLENLKVKPYGRPLAEILYELEKPLSDQFLSKRRQGGKEMSLYSVATCEQVNGLFHRWRLGGQRS